MTATAPIRALEYTYIHESVLNEGPREGTSPPMLLEDWTFSPPAIPDPSPWNWQIGTPLPDSKKVAIAGNLPFTVSVPESARQWLTVTPTQGTAPVTLTVTPKVSSLPAGTHTADIAVTFSFPPILAEVPAPKTSFHVVLNISPSPFLSLSDSAGNREVSGVVPVGAAAPIPIAITVQSTGQAAFAAAVSTSSGGNWLSVTPNQVLRPAVL